MFPLHPETPQQGQTLEDLFRTTPDKIKPMIARLQQVANELDLPFGKRTKTYNSRLAQELGLWADDQGKGDQFHMAAFQAYFAMGKNLADHEVLKELAESVGLPKEKAATVVNNRLYREHVDKDWADSKLKGITAVPTFVMGSHKLVGAQSYDALKELVSLYGAEEKGT